MCKRMLLAVALISTITTFEIAACAALTQKGTPCKRPASPGSDFCWQHGGSTKAEREQTAESGDTPKGADQKAADASDVAEWHNVSRVVDGDTLVLDDGTKIRLIGIDAPESSENDKLEKDAERTQRDKETLKRLGAKSTEYLNGICKDKKVRLEYDVDRKDRYGRTLAYLYLEDGMSINAQMIKAGFAHAYTSFPFKYMKEYRNLEAFARAAKKGLWAEDSPAAPNADTKSDEKSK